jgi:hypothetical protein
VTVLASVQSPADGPFWPYAVSALLFVVGVALVLAAGVKAWARFERWLTEVEGRRYRRIYGRDADHHRALTARHSNDVGRWT